MNERGVSAVTVVRLAVVPVIIATAAVLAWRHGYFDLDRRQHLLSFVREFHRLPWSEAFYVAAYSVAIAAVLPATLVTILGGALFGLWKGAALAWVGALAGTCLSHVLARHVARAPMRRLFGDHWLLRRLRDHSGVIDLFRLRILPVAPFATLDYIAGIAGVPLRRLVLATMVGVLPSVLAYGYVGAALVRGVTAGGDAARRALWIAAAITAFMLAISSLPMLLSRPRE